MDNSDKTGFKVKIYHFGSILMHVFIAKLTTSKRRDLTALISQTRLLFYGHLTTNVVTSHGGGQGDRCMMR